MEKFIEAFITHGGILGLFSLAFGAWAWVVWWFGTRILLEMKTLRDKLLEFNTKMTTMNYFLSNRLTKVESHLESHESHRFTPYRDGNE